MRMLRVLGLLSMAMLIAAGIAIGQAVNNAQIHGVVQDPSSAAVPGAHIKATQVDTGHTQETVSGADGSYSLPGLPIGAGAYTLSVDSPGFSAYQQTGIVLQVGSNVEVNVSLGLGSVTQEVHVSADAAMVQNEDTSISEVVDQKRIVELPLNGRQATDLIVLTGGAAVPPNAASRVVTSHDYVNYLGVSVFGGQINGNNYVLDGGDHNDSHSNVNLPFPFPDALQEFSVQTSGVSARYGLHPGSVINAVTKSGTNTVHGTAFEFLRNGAMNARNYFATSQDNLKRNQYGGTLGGPIRRNKIFLFGGVQETANRTSPPNSIAYVPTAAMLSGDFSQCSTIPQLYDPSTGQPLVGNKVNPTRFVTPSLNIVKLLPATTDPCGKVTYGIPNPSNEFQVVSKLDINLTPKHTLMARYFFLDYSNPSVYTKNVLTLSRAGLAQRVQSIVLGDQYILSPTIINNGHFTYSRLAVHRTNPGNFLGSERWLGLFEQIPVILRWRVCLG
jgi:lipopolysaccharide export system protein LptC